MVDSTRAGNLAAPPQLPGTEPDYEVSLVSLNQWQIAWRRFLHHRLAVFGSVLTAILAAIAAFELSLPDAPRGWAALPLPTAILWVAASGFGCLRVWIAPQTHVAALGEARDCLIFIIALSVPLSVLLLAMLRRACPLHPGLTAAVAGLAVAAAAASLLNFFHPYDAAATDLAVHAAAVAAVVAANRALSGRIFGAPAFVPIDVTANEVAPN